ncbi:hypothetical protein CI610_00898 [invertebrate metagenome]|uniref:Ectoine dioxygenase n=1 Tax=invertebrate metagenome TaxID=1711999 RepID=A0A2H9TA82_9ZZZZ
MITDYPKRLFSQHSPLSQQQWQSFFTRGYCIVDGLLPAPDVADVMNALWNLQLEAEQLAHTLPANFDGKTNHQGAQFVLKTDADQQLEKLYRVCGCGSADPVLLQASRHPRLLLAMADLLLAKQFEHIICQFHAKLPHDDVEFPPHRDIEFRLHFDPKWKDINHWGSYVIAVIAIDACSANNGGLALVPGSHLNITLDELKNGAAQDKRPQNTAVCPKLNPGDVLMMHPYLLHWSAPNTGANTRFTLLSGMCSTGANQSQYPGNCTNDILTVR